MGKSYVKGCVIAAGVILAMTGCGDSGVNLTSEQESQVGEYAAMALLRHDANNRSRLVSWEEVEAKDQELLQKEQEKQEQEQEETTEGMDPVKDTPVINEKTEQNPNSNTVESIEEFFGYQENISFAYRGVQICDSYPSDGTENDYFTLDATAGKHLLVLKFDMVNQSQTDQTVDLLSQNAVIKITVNGSFTRHALPTMLLEDLATYRGTVPAGSTVGLVLLVEIDNDVAQTLSSVSLNLKNDTDTYKVELQ